MNMVFKDKDGFSYKLDSEYLYKNHPFFRKDYIKDDGSDIILSTQVFNKYTEGIGLNGLGLYMYLISLATPNADFTFTTSAKELQNTTNFSRYMVKKYIELLRKENFIERLELDESKKSNIIITMKLMKPDNRYIYNPLLTKFHHHSDIDHTPGVRVSRYFTQFWSPIIGLASVGMYSRLCSLASYSSKEVRGIKYIVTGLGIREIASKCGTSVNTARKLIKTLEDYKLIKRNKEYNSTKNVYEDTYFLINERLNSEQVASLPTELQSRHEMWEHGELNWSIRKYPAKEFEAAFSLIQNTTDDEKENKEKNPLLEFKLKNDDKNNIVLNEFINRVSIPLQSKTKNIHFWLENRELEILLQEYALIKVKHKIEGETTLIQKICMVLDARFKGIYEHIIIDDTKKESLTWEYPKSKILIVTMNWFLSLGYLLSEKEELTKQDLDNLANKHQFSYEIIRS